MGFEISHISDTGIELYACLFDAADRTKAWNTDSASFETFTIESQSDFALALVEDEERSGFYAYDFENDIPAVSGDSYYFIEVWQRTGDDPDRANDELVGALQFFWDGTKEIAPFASNNSGLTAGQVWANEDRTLTSASPPTAQEIWEYATRTLTDDSSAALIAAILDIRSMLTSLESRLTTLETSAASIKANTEDIKTEVKKPLVTVNPQSPRIGQNGSVGPSNIRVR
jgi:hypothetical protein